MKRRIKKSFIEDSELFKCVSYAINLMSDYEVMTTQGAVECACKKYKRTQDEVYMCLGKDFKIAQELMDERKDHINRYPPCSEISRIATMKTLDSLEFG